MAENGQGFQGNGLESTTENMIEEIDTLVTEHRKCKKKIQAQNTQEIQHTMKRLNLQIRIIKEGEKNQIKDTENIFDKIIEQNFPELTWEISIKLQEELRIQNRLDQKLYMAHNNRKY